jgi:hypothetical protein
MHLAENWDKTGEFVNMAINIHAPQQSMNILKFLVTKYS